MAETQTNVSRSTRPVRIPMPGRARLDSISNPQPRPPPVDKKKPPPDQNCPNPDCVEKDVVQEGPQTVCNSCGTVIAENNMVTELQYGLAAGGQHVVHGHHVGADQAFARGDNSNAALSRLGDSREYSAKLGREAIIRIGTTLGVPANLRDHGEAIFRLAVGGFIQGRRIKSVAAVALYIAARVQKETHNTHMLIDFSDCLQLNVFHLGSVYKALLEYLAINGNGQMIQPINPEHLILRFAHRLEFGNETMKVANDAVRIVQRMNRDWMTPGRRPAGVCGAALIIAAHMNNFRRSVREVVYVVKVTETTIFHRLDEFKVTESSGLTVDEFRTIELERSADPPAFYQQKDGKKKRGRKRKHVEFGDDGDGDEPNSVRFRTGSAAPSNSDAQGSNTGSRAPSAAPLNTKGQLNTPANTQQQAQTDSEIMPPPPLPIDPNLLEVSAQRLSEIQSSQSEPPEAIEFSSDPAAKAASEPPPKRKRGRPRKNPATPPATQSTNVTALEPDIAAALTDPLDLSHATALHSALQSASTPTTLPTTQTEPSSKPIKSRPTISLSETLSESEFATDPEVADCLLTPEETAIKTRIWTHENREYIREQTARTLRQELAIANGTARTIIPRKRRKRRMGDMTAYVGEEQVGKPVAGSPAEAVMRMMGRRGFSTKINYGNISKVYDHSPGSGSPRGSDSLLAGSPGSGVEMTSALESPKPGKITESPGAEVAEESEIESEVGTGEKPKGVILEANKDEQRELDSVVGQLEEEGIDDDEDESVPADDIDDGDHYEGGYDSD